MMGINGKVKSFFQVYVAVLVSVVIFFILFWARKNYSVVSAHEPINDTIALVSFLIGLTLCYTIPVLTAVFTNRIKSLVELRIAVFANLIGVIFALVVINLPLRLPGNDFTIAYVMLLGSLLTYSIFLKYIVIYFKSKEWNKFAWSTVFLLSGVFVILTTVWGMLYFE